ncbi:type IX secretion system anionic LPS delivery protein PorZ [Prevotella aurantiaca]|jgi:two component regulator propeller|uniref:T9SS type A sorting domain-containing protein n=1 Tax=Prevotella aurantiaca TaxID=596085 RepID=A0A930MYU5_9BACT|nr:T9SS type A sorting domain-containing protein [Prevotella aurantiaca]MBF1383843.1 T9SS type A sorting domain-containing protein [Prevotella aurantiaca]
MMKRTNILAIICLLLMFPLYSFSSGTGTWKNYMAYSNVQWIEKGGNLLYVLASNDLYTYNEKDNSIQTFDKINGLNDTHIEFIAWNNVAQRLVIAYSDQNIDLLTSKGEIISLSDYYRKAMTANKKINSLYTNGAYCYISTGFGILKVNVGKAEISDTYNLGFNVNYTFIEGNYIYAASSEQGIFRALLSDNLLDKNNWQWVSNYVAQNKTIAPELLEKVKALQPGGPKYNRFFFMQYLNDRLYSTGGAFEPGAIGLNQPGTIQILKKDEWSIFQDELDKITGYYYHDMNCLAVDPKNPEHVFVGGRAGLYEFLDGKLKKYFNKENSLLHPTINTITNEDLGNDYVPIQGLIFDRKNNLWILNCGTRETSLLKLSPDGTMTDHSKPELMNGKLTLQVMRRPILDSRGLIWFVNNHYEAPGLFCYNPETDKLSVFKNFKNQDGAPIMVIQMRCVVEDAYQNIWVGTNVGPLRLNVDQMQNPSDAIFEQIKIPRNDGTNLADYLLAGVDISSIAIDGGGRKWFGTNGNGVYLISADNMKQVQHFLSSNSKLLSNDIESIAINDKTGEVFIGTEKGLCSYMSDATKPSDNPGGEDTYAYPNPVRPGYTGLITVVGLAYNSDVKIVTTNGVLVAKGTSNGGTFTWDGNDLNGKRVASGVYMVQTADQEGNNGTVCKIAVVN